MVMIERNAPLESRQIEALRLSVGWDATPGQYQHILARSYAYFSVKESDQLVAFLNVLSDGVDALLLDLMVHPAHQGRGLGQALVSHAVECLLADGITFIQVVFDPALEGFYRKCGFDIIRAGVIDRTAAY
jgi:GNAT superfamily N-acetyltransferase